MLLPKETDILVNFPIYNDQVCDCTNKKRMPPPSVLLLVMAGSGYPNMTSLFTVALYITLDTHLLLNKRYIDT
jgi:hypothetical protein